MVDCKCRFCEGEPIAPVNDDDTSYAYVQLLNGEALDNFFWLGDLDKDKAYMGFNSAAYEYEGALVPIRFCPFCGKNLEKDVKRRIGVSARW